MLVGHGKRSHKVNRGGMLVEHGKRSHKVNRGGMLVEHGKRSHKVNRGGMLMEHGNTTVTDNHATRNQILRRNPNGRSVGNRSSRVG